MQGNSNKQKQTKANKSKQKQTKANKSKQKQTKANKSKQSIIAFVSARYRGKQIENFVLKR